MSWTASVKFYCRNKEEISKLPNMHKGMDGNEDRTYAFLKRNVSLKPQNGVG
jgi:hypothetical protein